ncbi:MAG: cytochrome c [Gammaproteobacteria bacterium]
MLKNRPQTLNRLPVMACVAVIASALVADAISQAPPSPSPARRAIDERKAIFTLIGANFRPLGEVLQGRATLDASEVRKRAGRVAFLATLASDAFGDVSNVGDPGTRAKPEIWSHRADFDKTLVDFVAHAQALSEVAAKQGSGSEEFKAAAGAVAQDCKSCHDNFRSK